MIPCKHFNKDFSPKLCTACGSTEFKEVVIDSISGQACEVETRCSKCSELLAFWGYGNYDPCFYMSYHGLD